MKFSIATVTWLLLAEQASAFAPHSPLVRTSSSSRFMAMDMPPVEQQVEAPIVKQSGYGPVDVRYSDFLKMIDSNKVEKVTFSADGTQLLGVGVDGARLKIESLPNDPSLLTELTSHKVRQFAVFADISCLILILTVFVVKLCFVLGRCHCSPRAGRQWLGQTRPEPHLARCSLCRSLLLEPEFWRSWWRDGRRWK